MRRGLMGWDEAELPRSVLEARLERLQAAMARDGLDALLLYTNLVRPAAVCWLTGFTPYWIESLLFVPASGTPMLATALSKRVADWIRTTAWLDEIVNTPKPGTAIGQRLAGCKRVGVLELDALPAGLHDDMVAAAPAVELVDASAMFAAVRSGVDDAERKLIEKADALAVAALAQVNASATDAGALAGLVEKHARLAGAEEAYIAIAPDLDLDRRLIQVSGPVPLARRFAVRASIAYKGAWVRRTRSIARDPQGARAMASGEKWLAKLVSWRSAGAPFGVVISTCLSTELVVIGGVHVSEIRNWTAESCMGSYPLEVVASSHSGARYMPAAGTFLVASVELALDDVPWLGAAPMFVRPGVNVEPPSDLGK
jgi:Creatinase/Prolidase N-terminal domain